MDKYDARLRLFETITDILVDLSADEDADDNELDEAFDTLSNVTEMIFDALCLTVVSVDNNVVTVSMAIPSEDSSESPPTKPSAG